MSQEMRQEQTIKVWDIAVRVFHWSLVVGVTVAWLTTEGMAKTHIAVGYVVLSLIAFRLIWGLIGPHYARFSQFLVSPSKAIAYLRDIRQGREARYVGHNPAGSAMILVLLASLIGTGVTGWMSTTDAYWGIEWVSNLHEALATLTLILIFLHVAGVILASLRHDENLPKAMITGRKRRPDTGDVA